MVDVNKKVFKYWDKNINLKEIKIGYIDTYISNWIEF